MEITLEMGGINYLVHVDVEDDYVSGVLGVDVFDGEIFFPIDMDSAQRELFFKRYEDDLNDAYRDHQIAIAEICAEDKWEASRGN